MKTRMLLAALLLAPMTSSAFDFNWGRVEVADEQARRVILQEMAGYSDSGLTPIKAAVKDAKTRTELAKTRADFESWKMAAMQKRAAEASKIRINSYYKSQTDLVNAVRMPVHATNGGWGNYFDGANKTSASSRVEADLPAASMRYNYGKVRGIALSQGAKKMIVDAAIEEATLQGVDPNLVLAIIQKESGYRSGAVSEAGAIGLMQLLPSTARDMGVSDPKSLFNVRTNIRAGIKYLRWVSDYLRLDINFKNIRQVAAHKKRALLAAYNAGIGNVRKWRKQQGENFRILFAETRNYVSEILGVLSAVGW